MNKVHINKRKELEDFFQIKENYNLVRPDRLAEVDGLLSGETYEAIASRKNLSRERIRQRLWKEVRVINYRERIRKEMRAIKRRMNQDNDAYEATTPIMEAISVTRDIEWWDVLNLSIRSRNCLEDFATYDRQFRVNRAQLVKYEEFRKKLEAEGIKFLLKLPNCGSRSANEIIGAVRKFESQYMCSC